MLIALFAIRSSGVNRILMPAARPAYMIVADEIGGQASEDSAHTNNRFGLLLNRSYLAGMQNMHNVCSSVLLFNSLLNDHFSKRFDAFVGKLIHKRI